MTVKIEFADGYVEVKESERYSFSTVKDMHPGIVKAVAYSNGKKIFTIKRRWIWFYKKFTFKSEKVQNQLKELSKQNEFKEE